MYWKRIITLALLVLSSAILAHSQTLPVVPYPADVEFEQGSFEARGAKVRSSLFLAKGEKKLVKELAQKMSGAAELNCKELRKRGRIVFHRRRGLANEEYEMRVKPGRIDIYASGYSGTLYAIRTLEQLLPVDRSGNWPIACVRIKDKPRFAYRGMLLDCSRHFFEVEEIKKLLDLMSMYKLNRFHWHLTDDHGWRAEIKSYPRLTEVGGFREGTMVGWDFNSNDGIRYGGYYTQDQMREVVAYATQKGIEVVPEIDLPAHLVSALKAYPELGCTGGPYELMTVWDIAKDVLCVGKEESFEFIEAVFDELSEIFPYEYVHIGGDECPKTRWEECPACQQRIAELGLKDSEKWSAEHYLQNYVTSRVQAYLATKSKRIIGWDEIMEGDLKPGATIMSWRGVAGGVEAARNGFDAIMTPCDYCYLDYCQSDKPELEPISIGHYVPVEKSYSYEPTEGLDAEASEHIIGVQANLWTEFIATADYVQYMLLPRLLALSEVQWSPSEVKDFARFKADLISHQFPLLDSLGYNYCKVVMR